MASYNPTNFASRSHDVNHTRSASPFQPGLLPSSVEYTRNYQHPNTINMSAVYPENASYYGRPASEVLSPSFSWQQYDSKISAYDLAWNRPQVSRVTSPLSSLADCSLVEDSPSLLSPYGPPTFEPVDYATQLSFPNSPEENWVHVDDLGLEHSPYNYPLPYDNGGTAVLLNMAPYPKSQQHPCLSSTSPTQDVALFDEEDTPRKRKRISAKYSEKQEDGFAGLFEEADGDDGSDYNPQPNKRSKTRVSPKTEKSRSRKSCLHNHSSGSSKISTVDQKSNTDLSIGSKNNKSAVSGHRVGEKTSSKAALNQHATTTSTRQFACIFQIYGCTSHFGSKNEWKRHIATKHLRTAYWRCHLGRCLPVHPEDQPKDFNRKDLFMQHIRRMHTPAHVKNKKEMNESVDEIARNCFHHVRDPPPRSICGYCYASGKKENFSGLNSWEHRMEHIGKHLESPGIENRQCMHDSLLEAWLVEEGLIVRNEEGDLVLESLVRDPRGRSR